MFGETPVTFRAPADASDSTAAVALGGAAPPLTEAQRKILVALCRPLKDTAYATPGHEPRDRGRGPPQRRRREGTPARVFERFGLDELPQNQKRARLAATALVNGVVRQHEF